MSVVFDPVGDDALAGLVTSPLSSIEILSGQHSDPVNIDAGTWAPRRAARPLALRQLRPAPQREIPEHLYNPDGDHQRCRGGPPVR